MDASELHALEGYLKGRLTLQIGNVRHGLKLLSDKAGQEVRSVPQDALQKIDQMLHYLESEAQLFLEEARITHQTGTPLTPERTQYGVRAAIMRCHTVHGMDY